MKHRVGYNRLGRKASHRKSLHRNMATSLFRYERIKTTRAKALAIRRTAEKMITRAKEDTVHNRRMVARDINDKEVLAKLFTDIGPRYVKRQGGYTRILKLGHRQGDAAEMVLLELVEEELEESSKKKKKASGKSQPKKKGKSTSKKPEAKAETVESEETGKTDADVSEEGEEVSETTADIAVESEKAATAEAAGAAATAEEAATAEAAGAAGADSAESETTDEETAQKKDEAAEERDSSKDK